MAPRCQPLLSREELLQLYFEAGLSLRAIAELKGTNYRLVRDSFKAHGLKWHTKSEAGYLRPPMDEETRSKIARSRTGFKDTPEVATRKREILRTSGGWGWNKGLTAETDPRVARQRDAAVAVMRTRDWREARSRQKADQIATGTYYARGYCDTQKAGRVYYMSGWELRRWKELDSDPLVVVFRVQPCRIPYEWEGPRNYIPDALITYTDGTIVLEEVKPQPIIDAALADPSSKLAAKLIAGAQHASVNGWGWRVFSYPGR